MLCYISPHVFTIDDETLACCFGPSRALDIHAAVPTAIETEWSAERKFGADSRALSSTAVGGATCR